MRLCGVREGGDASIRSLAVGAAQAPRRCECDDRRRGGDERDDEQYGIHVLTSA
jgi:hypothetical protein